jgi:hypothetical protein
LIISEGHAFDVILLRTVGLTPCAIQLLRVTVLYFPADGHVSYFYGQWHLLRAPANCHASRPFDYIPRKRHVSYYYVQ